MASFVIRRTLYAVVTLLILSLTIFTVVRLTGDPVTLMAEPGARAEDLDRIRVEWGLDRPLPVQYLSFLKNIATGELGNSFNYEMPVSTLYFQRLPNSLELAWLKGLPGYVVVALHAFKNALIPVLTLAGVDLVVMINAAVIIEVIFAWPGIGRLLYEGIFQRDFPLVQGVVMEAGIMIVVVNLTVDILYAYIDHRIRLTK